MATPFGESKTHGSNRQQASNLSRVDDSLNLAGSRGVPSLQSNQTPNTSGSRQPSQLLRLFDSSACLVLQKERLPRINSLLRDLLVVRYFDRNGDKIHLGVRRDLGCVPMVRLDFVPKKLRVLVGRSSSRLRVRCRDSDDLEAFLDLGIQKGRSEECGGPSSTGEADKAYPDDLVIAGAVSSGGRHVPT